MNYFYRIINKIYTDIYNHLDKRTNRHIVVIESDDWGSIRVPSRSVYDALIDEGFAMSTRPYERYDCLETDEDILALSEVLMKHQDAKGNHPIITMNYLCANPDFDQIKRNGYKTYFYKTINETYLDNIGSENVITLVKDGIEKGIFRSQCHGREHFNVLEWLNALRSGNQDVLTAFRYGMCGIFPKNNPSIGNQYMVAFRSNNDESMKYVCQVVSMSLNMFKEIWGYHSLSYIAPCYTWNDEIEKVLATNGVKLMQGGRVRRSSNSLSQRFYYAGEIKNGLVHSIRNCSFEPSTTKNFSIQALMNEIDNAFKNNKIAVISSHRINYVGGIDVENRERNLNLLDRLLTILLKKYPTVEFLSSDKLINIL